MAASIDGDLAQHLTALRREKGDSIPVEDLGDVVRSLLSSLSGDLTAGDIGLFREVEELAAYIRNAKAEIAALRPSDIQATYIASATDELDAIVDATETATNTILDGAEVLGNMVGQVTPEQGEILNDVTTRIFEACNFQDITGQRITKVVKALKHIEERIDALVEAFGPEFRDKTAAVAPAPLSTERSDEDLLNGPQLPTTASDQASIDALFND